MNFPYLDRNNEFKQGNCFLLRFDIFFIKFLKKNNILLKLKRIQIVYKGKILLNYLMTVGFLNLTIYLTHNNKKKKI